jgi:hypothetical protein
MHGISAWDFVSLTMMVGGSMTILLNWAKSYWP